MQRACTTSGDHGKATSLPTLWDSLPSIDVVGDEGCDCDSVKSKACCCVKTAE
ncbi:hypothetical protein HanXRQr2_Chr03g0091381 [Helianthus annuus]|uniref:Uncharacterized protein n=1 Tax=Helianthus annuus TaxID=4232 RepID=A0A9K3NU83_HELAN|nr:hypothetical protein HanXRQr2_Chr03g0091381 [Helianthus annuus]